MENVYLSPGMKDIIKEVRREATFDLQEPPTML